MFVLFGDKDHDSVEMKERGGSEVERKKKTREKEQKGNTGKQTRV